MADDNYGSDNTNDPTIDFGDEFGVVRFGSDDDSGPALSFGGNETEQLPHWTEPATGEIPRFIREKTAIHVSRIGTANNIGNKAIELH